jgi:hypothetical protein
MFDDKWLAEFTKPQEIPQSTVEYLLQLSPGSLPTVIKFPPSCVVKAKDGVELACPRKGFYGLVTSYTRDGSDVKVTPAPYDKEAQFAGMCDPDWLEVVGYWRGLTPDKVRSIIEASTN